MPPLGDDPARVALVGYGLGGRLFPAPLIASAPGLSLVTIVEAPPARPRARESYPSAGVLDRPLLPEQIIEIGNGARGLRPHAAIAASCRAPSDVCN